MRAALVTAEIETAYELDGDANHLAREARMLLRAGHVEAAWRRLELAAFYSEHAKCAMRRARIAASEARADESEERFASQLPARGAA